MPESRQKNRTKLAAGGILVLGLILAGGLIIFARYRSKNEDGERAAFTGDISSLSSDTVVWNGVEYQYNLHLTNYMLLGIDNREKTAVSSGEGSAGQADAIYLAACDRLNNSVTVITIPRDTITEIELFGPGGKSLGTNQDHISLSYAYGDGSHQSCNLTKNAVSGLLYGIPIQSYCALNMDGLPVLTESVGGLEVTVPNDSLEKENPEYAKGETVFLTADNTELFVRYRDTQISQSALERMERQQAYIRSFGEKAQKIVSEDPGFASELYLSLEPYMVTNMDAGEFAELASRMAEGTFREGWTIPGEGTEGDRYDEYYADDAALYEKVIETFYEETEE